MPKVGSSRRDKGPDSMLPESRIVNEDGAEKFHKLMVPEGQREASVVTPANYQPTTDQPGRVVIFVSFVAAGLVPTFSTFFSRSLTPSEFRWRTSARTRWSFW